MALHLMCHPAGGAALRGEVGEFFGNRFSRQYLLSHLIGGCARFTGDDVPAQLAVWFLNLSLHTHQT